MEITKDEIKRLSDVVSRLLTNNINADGTLNFGGLTFDMAIQSKQEALARIPSRHEPKCNVYYDGCNTEYMIWMLGLMSTSWLFTLLKSKTEKGHCQIRDKPDPPLCRDGSNFHNKFYLDCLESYEQLLRNIKEDTPSLVK